MRDLDDERVESARRRGHQLDEMRFTGGAEILALVHERTGERERAVEILERAVATTPHVWRLWQLLGNVRDGLGRYEDALAAYASALGCADVDAASIRYNRAVVLDRLGKHEEALNDLRAARAAAPGDNLLPLIVRGTVDALLAIGRAEEAVAVARAEVESVDAERPLFPELNVELGWALWRAHRDRDEARATLERNLAWSSPAPGERALALARALEGITLASGFMYTLTVRALLQSLSPPTTSPRWRRLLMREPSMPVGYLRVVRVAAADEPSALRLAAALEFPEARDSVAIEEVSQKEPLEPEVAAGVYWRSGALFWTKT